MLRHCGSRAGVRIVAQVVDRAVIARADLINTRRDRRRDVLVKLCLRVAAAIMARVIINEHGCRLLAQRC